MTMLQGAISENQFEPREIEQALELVDILDTRFHKVGVALSRACASNGELEEQKLEEHQLLCYEFAFAAAELKSIRHFLESQLKKAASQDLALIFAGETIAELMNRFEKLGRGLGLPNATNTIRTLPIYTQVLAQSSPSHLERAGHNICRSGDLFHDISTNEQVDLARDMFRRFAKDHIAPIAGRIHRENLTVPDSLLDQMREMGVFGLSIPEQYGGSAPNNSANTQTMIAVTEALSESSLGAGGSLITRPEILARAIMAGGSEDQKADWLPRIASGEALAAISITEPDYGSDVANLNLKATKADGGWVLNGAKTWCTFAGKADVLMVVARTGGELGYRGLSIFLVEKPRFDGHEIHVQQENGGQLQGRSIPTIGYRGMHSFELSFDDFFVPDANLLGREAGLGRGFYFTMNGMTGGRIQTAARASGVMMAAIGASIRYTNNRKIFGKPLAEHQLIKAKIASMAARFHASRTLAYEVAEQLDCGNGQMEASLAKLFACRSAEMITREAVQIHGGMGYAEETAVSRYFVDARVLSIFEGAEEALAIRVIARSILTNHLNSNGG